jgi:hypothetical protein
MTPTSLSAPVARYTLSHHVVPGWIFPNEEIHSAAVSAGGIWLQSIYIFMFFENQKRLDFVALCERLEDREVGRNCRSRLCVVEGILRGFFRRHRVFRLCPSLFSPIAWEEKLTVSCYCALGSVHSTQWDGSFSSPEHIWLTKHRLSDDPHEHRKLRKMGLIVVAKDVFV